MSDFDKALLNGGAYPPIEGMQDDVMEALFANAREAYTNGAAAILDRTLEEFLLPEYRQAVTQDFGLFIIFLCSIYMAEKGGYEVNKKTVMNAYQQLMKRAKTEVPEQIMVFFNPPAEEETDDAG